MRIFTGPYARQQAVDYAKERYGNYVEKRLEPYSPAVIRHIREMTKPR